MGKVYLICTGGVRGGEPTFNQLATFLRHASGNMRSTLGPMIFGLFVAACASTSGDDALDSGEQCDHGILSGDHRTLSGDHGSLSGDHGSLSGDGSSAPSGSGTAWGSGSDGVSGLTTNGVVVATGSDRFETGKLFDDGAKFQFTNSGIPLQLMYMGTSTWDIAPITSSNVDRATITMFGQTSTTMPSVDNSLNFRLVAGTGGAGGVQLSPNGKSYMDPDGYADHGHIFAIGHLNPQYELDVRDTGVARVPVTDCVADSGNHYQCAVISAKGQTTFATGSGASVEYYAVSGDALGTRISGTANLTNVGLHGNATGGDTNLSLATDNGNVILNRLGTSYGTTLIHGTTTMDAGSTTISGSKTLITGTSPYTLSVGPESDDAYFINGGMNYGWNVNTTDHLSFNFSGYRGGNTQYRDLNIYDGKNNLVASWTGANKAFESKGEITGVNYTNGGPSGPKWLSGTGSPEGNYPAPVGSLFSRTDGGASATLYVKESGTGNTGWVAK